MTRDTVDVEALQAPILVRGMNRIAANDCVVIDGRIVPRDEARRRADAG